MTEWEKGVKLRMVFQAGIHAGTYRVSLSLRGLVSTTGLFIQIWTNAVFYQIEIGPVKVHGPFFFLKEQSSVWKLQSELNIFQFR